MEKYKSIHSNINQYTQICMYKWTRRLGHKCGKTNFGFESGTSRQGGDDSSPLDSVTTRHSVTSRHINPSLLPSRQLRTTRHHQLL